MAFIKADKLGRIYAVVFDKKSNVTPPELKNTLNMFRGRQLKSALRECLNYAKISVAAQLPAGFKELSPEEQKEALRVQSEAQKELDRIHYMWNN